MTINRKTLRQVINTLPIAKSMFELDCELCKKVIKHGHYCNYGEYASLKFCLDCAGGRAERFLAKYKEKIKLWKYNIKWLKKHKQEMERHNLMVALKGDR